MKKNLKNFKIGEKLYNNTKHKAKTNSEGFCFINEKDFTPEEAVHFLSGIVSFDICAVFETNEKLKKTYGIYAKPIKRSEDFMNNLINILLNVNETITIDEYCINEYDNKKFKLLKYSKDIWKQWNPAENQANLKWEDEIKRFNSERSATNENSR